jgi:hypothetical protein
MAMGGHPMKRWIVELGKINKRSYYIGTGGMYTRRVGFAEKFTDRETAEKSMNVEKRKYGYLNARIVEVEEVEG